MNGSKKLICTGHISRLMPIQSCYSRHTIKSRAELLAFKVIATEGGSGYGYLLSKEKVQKRPPLVQWFPALAIH